MVKIFVGPFQARRQSSSWCDRSARSQGFTLIELLTIVFVIGIILVIALPTYMNYANRAKLSEALGVVGPVRRAVDEYWAQTGQLPASNASVALGAPDQYAGRYVSGIELIGNGVIQVSLDDAGLQFGQLLFTPSTPAGSSVLQWRCSSPNIAPQHLPKECRP